MKKTPLSSIKIQKIISSVLKEEKIKRPWKINVLFVDNKTIRRLSRLFLQEDHVTDVIAFPYSKLKFSAKEDPFGDVVISLPQAKKQSQIFQQPYQKEVIRLIVHGVLHLLGYSDKKKKSKKIMWEKQEKLVSTCYKKHR